MRVLIQRTENASVTVEDKAVGSIIHGLVVFVGFTETDSIETIKWMAKKVLNLRIFPDENEVMNKSLLDVGGSILSISQFTLYADTSKGNRPSYVNALGGNEAVKLYELFNEELMKSVVVETGVFGADMNVEIHNIGPTTILLER